MSISKSFDAFSMVNENSYIMGFGVLYYLHQKPQMATMEFPCFEQINNFWMLFA